MLRFIQLLIAVGGIVIPIALIVAPIFFLLKFGSPLKAAIDKVATKSNLEKIRQKVKERNSKYEGAPVPMPQNSVNSDLKPWQIRQKGISEWFEWDPYRTPSEDERMRIDTALHHAFKMEIIVYATPYSPVKLGSVDGMHGIPCSTCQTTIIPTRVDNSLRTYMVYFSTGEPMLRDVTALPFYSDSSTSTDRYLFIKAFRVLKWR